MRCVLVPLAASLFLGGCVMPYELVQPAPVSVANGSMTVKPTIAWNKAPGTMLDTAWEESWTQNGPLLDTIRFIGALPSGQAIIRQQAKDARKVPVFRDDMTPQDLVSMIESCYRIKAGATIFETTGVRPVTFLGKPAVQHDYKYVGVDEIKRRGRTIMAVVDGKLYLISLDAAALHYFDAALPEMEAIVKTATIS